MENTARQYKIILIGDPGVGKTSYFMKIRNPEVHVGDTDTVATVLSGVEYLEYRMKIDGADVLVNLHDTGGGERFRTLTSNFYRNSDAAIMMFSVEDQYTFENLQEWWDNASDVIPDIDNFVWAVMGNKCDLPLEIEHESIDTKCKTWETTLKFFTSAKTGERVLDSFEDIIKEVHKRSLARQQSGIPQPGQNHGVKITNLSSATSQKKCNC